MSKYTQLIRLQQQIAELSNCPSLTAKPAQCSNTTSKPGKPPCKAPPNTPYSSGSFHLLIIFPHNYPFVPPKVTFATKIYHPNINQQGVICLDLLKELWTPLVKMSKIFKEIYELIGKPCTEVPIMAEIGRQYREDRHMFQQVARDWTHKYAN